MKKPMAFGTLKPVKAWAWAIDWNQNKGWSFCFWAEPSKERLLERSKPTPEARAMPVWISLRDTLGANTGQCLSPRKKTPNANKRKR